MNSMLTAANKNFRSIGESFTNFYRSASPVDSVSQEIYAQQAFYIYYMLLGFRLSSVTTSHQRAIDDGHDVVRAVFL